MMVRKIVAAIVVVAVAVGGYLYYLDATAPLESKLDSTDKIVYAALTDASMEFKNPASVRIVDGYIDYKNNTVYAKISGENSMGGHNTGYYELDADGTINLMDNAIGSAQIEMGKAIIKNVAAGYGSENYGTFHCDKINEAFASHHK